MTTDTRESCTIWVCTDCLETEASGQYPEYLTDDRDPWCLIPIDAFVTPGLVVAEHNDDCPNVDHDTGEWLGVGDCTGCEAQDFSWSRCDGCGSNLGGTRHAYTYWSDL